MEIVTRRTHVVRRAGSTSYYFRIQVPPDLHAHYGKKEIWRTLKTSDLREANRRVAAELLKQEQEFDDARRRLNPEPVAELTDLEIERLVLLQEHRALEAQERLQFMGIGGVDFLPKEMTTGENTAGHSDADLTFLQQFNDVRLALHKEELTRGNFKSVTGYVNNTLAERGIKLAPTALSYRKLCYKTLQTLIKTLERQNERLAGKVVETPPAPPPLPERKPNGQPETDDGPTLTEVFERWSKERLAAGVREKSIREFATPIRRFTELHGNLPVKQITKAHLREYKAAMLVMPAKLSNKERELTVPQVLKKYRDKPDVPKLSIKTINEKLLTGLSSVMKWAEANGYVDQNPCGGLRIAKSKGAEEVKRLTFSIDDLNRIFRFPVYTQEERPLAGGGEAAKWLPLLALYTGARLEELGQLEIRDVRHQNGIDFLDLTPGEGKKLKSPTSRRWVPIHPMLKRLGFMEYVAGLEPSGRLFPALRSEQGQRTAAWSKWWGRYHRRYGMDDTRKVFHCFRHTFKLGLREARVPEELSDKITGHASQSVGRRYGTSELLGVLAEEVAKLEYPGLDLGHLL